MHELPLRSNYGVYTEKGKQHEETDFMFGSYLERSITLNPEKNSESGKVYVKGKAAGKKIAGVYTIDMINHRRDAHLAKSVTIGCGDACNPYAFS